MQLGCGETGPGHGALTPGGRGLSQGSNVAVRPALAHLSGSSQQLQARPPPATGKQQTLDFPLNLYILLGIPRYLLAGTLVNMVSAFSLTAACHKGPAPVSLKQWLAPFHREHLQVQHGW